MSNFNKEKFLKDYTELYNQKKQGQAQSASVAVNGTGGFDKEKFLADYTKLWNEKQAADYARNRAETKQTVTDKEQTQQQNYNQMQSLFNKSAQADLDNVNRQIQAISGYGVGADRSNLQSLLQRKDSLEKQLKTGRYDEDLTALERLQLTAQGIGESYDAVPGVLVDTAIGAIKGEKVDMNSDAIKAMQRAQQASQQATYGLGDGAAFLYNTGASIAENASMLPLGALPGGQAAVLGMMGAKAAAQKTVEVGEKGGSAKSALLRGLGSGAIEAATEKLPLDNLTKLITGDVGKSIIKNMLVQAGEEATEEGVAYLANLMLDKIAKDPDAKFSLDELLQSVAGGFISGGVMGGGASLVGRNVRGNSNQQDVADTNDGKIAEDTNVPGKTAENTVLQSTAKTAERAELENEVAKIMGIDTRSEAEKVSEKQREYVDNVQKLVDKGIAPAEHLEQAQRKAEETVKEAVNKQANLDYQKLDADSGRVRQEAVDSGKGKLIEDIERFTNKRGFKVKYYSADADSVGNGFIDGDTIYINVQDSNVMAKTAIHETIHGLRGNNQAEYTKLYDSIMNYAEQYKYLHDVADNVMAAYTNPDSVAYNSVLDDAGNVDADKLGEEVLCKLCEEVIKDPEGFIKNVDGNRTVLDAVADLLRKIKNSLAITLTKSESAKLDNAVMAIERYVRSGAAQTEKKYSVHYDVNDRPFVEIDNDILAGVPQADWVETVKKAMRTHQIPIGNFEIAVNAVSRSEYTNSKYTKQLKQSDAAKYENKLRMVDNLDEIVQNAYNTKNENARHKNFASFNRGHIDVRIGNNDYSIEVVTGISNTNRETFYDIVNIQPTTIQKRSIPYRSENNRPKKKGNASYVNNITQLTENDNGNNLSDNSGNKLTAEQAEFFKNSVARDAQGRLLNLYHQTDADFTEFKTKSTGAGRYDAVMPDGIFVKPTAADIGLKGKKQMALYANITKPLQFRDRGEMARYWKRNVEGYADVQEQIVKTDEQYQQKYDAADLLEDEHYKKIRKQLINKEITAEEFRTMLEETETKKILAEWTATSNDLRAKAKELINGYIANNDFDGIILENDAGSFGRSVKSYVVFNSNQLKNTDNAKPTTNADIRYSSNTSADSDSGDAAEDLKGKTIRERIEARANSGVTAKSQNVQTKAENALIRTISNAFGVRYTDKQGIIKEMVKEISAQVKATGAVDVADIDRLVDTAFSKGVISSNEKAKMYPRLKAELRESRFKYQPSEVFQDMRNNYFGKLRFAKDGTDVDILYQQYNGKYPDLFPEDIKNPEDQIVRIGEVYDSLAENEQSLAEYYGDSSEEMKSFIKEDLQYAIGRYIQELQGVERFEADKRIAAGEKAVAKDRKPPTMAEYKAAQDEAHRAQKVVDKLLRDILLTDKEMRLIDTLLKGGDPDTVTGPNRDKILAVYAAKKAVKDARAPIRAYQFDVMQKRNDVADDVLTTFRSWKDKKLGLGYSTETFERNILDIVPDKAEAKRIIDTYITPIHTAEAQSNRLKKAMRDRVRALNIDSKANNRNAKLYGISVFDKGKPYDLQADESGLVQLYGEKKITKEQLGKVGADVSKIENAVAEFRKIYEELYEQANNALLRNGYAPLGKIEDYFPHFTEENDTVLSKLAAKAGFEVQTNRLPTSIAGLTETFKPGKNWWGNMQHRTGDTTLFDAVTGFDQYIEGVANIINQTDNIQNLRALENRLRYLASDEGVRTEMDRIDTLDISETEKYELKQQLKEEVENSSLPNFVTYLRDYTNNIAGKKDFSDRQIEHDFGRGIYTVSKALEGRIASNMIGANIGSALTNFIPIAQAKAAIKTKYLVNAMNDTMRAFYGNDNGFENESDFLTNRFGSEKLVYTRAQKMSNMAGWLMNVCDRFTSNVVSRARYLQNIDNGMSSDEAMADANSFAAGLIADRSKGAVPLVFERKNPIVKAVTMFQVEQNNQLRYLAKDLPKDLEKKGVTALVWAIVQYSVASWLYNELYKIFVGRRPAFDPIDIGFGLVKDAQAVAKGEMKTSAALTNAATAISEELPFVSGLVGGGRIPISSALPDAAEVIKLFDSDVSADKKKSIAKKELTKPLWYLATPTGGGQLKKAVEAAELYGKNDGVQYSVQSDGSKKAQFAVDKTAGNVLQSALFGKWSSDEAQAYIDNGFKGLSKKQTEAFDGLKGTGMSNKDAWAAADWKGADTDGNNSIKTEEARAYLDSKGFTRDQKAILFSCMCPNVKNNPYK